MSLAAADSDYKISFDEEVPLFKPFGDSENRKINKVKGVVGAGIELVDNDAVTLTSSVTISSDDGTISFWLKPFWETETEHSHVFMTMPWDDPDHGYFALSYGWWEPKGRNRLYFIINNQQKAHCALPINFIQDKWVMITVSWNQGTCKIYIDDELAVSKKVTNKSKFLSKSEIVIGAEFSAISGNRRRSDFLIDEIKFLSSYVNDKYVYDKYEKESVFVNIGERFHFKSDSGTNPRAYQERYIFDEGKSWAVSKSNTDKILRRIKKAGFTTYVVNVWHGRGARYPTKVAPIDSDLDALELEYDPFDYLLRKANDNGIKVHAWFTYARREESALPQFVDEGTPDRAFNVHLKSYQNFFLNLLEDFVARYSVDGINLDYIRTIGICDSSYCKQQYAAVSGRDLDNDLLLRFVSKSARNSIAAWQDETIDNVVLGARKIIDEHNGEILLSVDTHLAAPGSDRPLQGRDALKWFRNGWVDIIFNMDYRKRFDFKTHDKVLSKFKDKNNIIMLLGNYEKIDNKVISRSGELINSMALFSQNHWPNSGVAFYLYSRLSDEQIESLSNGAFRLSPGHTKQ